jgi:deoxycytidylate deaminase
MADRLTKQGDNDYNTITLLFELASKSERIAKARIAAALTIRKRVIAVGTNSLKTHPFQKKYSSNDDSICIHAENNVIMKALRVVSVEDLEKATIYVARAKKVGPGGKFIYGNAMPCAGCQKAIAAFGIKNVIYTTDEGKFECL